ncbi:DUF946 family protein, partial [Trifolium medium]|nr:DUF946 family protein [Trifolium medium]
EWGPHIDYKLDDELKAVEKFLPGKLKDVFENIVRGLPKEMLGEEGPTGPKEKASQISMDTSLARTSAECSVLLMHSKSWIFYLSLQVNCTCCSFAEIYSTSAEDNATEF